MPVKTILSDTFEQLVELGQSTAKKTSPQSPLSPKSPESLKSKKGNHTPLDFENLQKKYADQDLQKTQILRQRLFQLVKSGEEKMLMKKRQEELEKKRKLAYEEQEKKRKEEEKKKREQMAEIPRGKIRRSIFTPLKVAKRQTAEVRPATGKQ